MNTVIRSLDFQGHDIFVAMDTHKKNWKTCILTKQMEHKIFTQPPQVDKLVHYLKKNFPGVVIIVCTKSALQGFGFSKPSPNREWIVSSSIRLTFPKPTKKV